MPLTEPGTSYGYQYHQFFGPNPTSGPLPRTPQPALSIHFEPTPEDECRCPFCETDAWYRQSPLCRYWRTDCELCEGRRTYYRWIRKYVKEGPFPCDMCRERWREQVQRFKAVLKDPELIARERKQHRRYLLRLLYELDSTVARQFQNCPDHLVLIDLANLLQRHAQAQRR